jgi:hypothetical protein
MELAAPFALTLPAVSKHLKVLEKAGLISKGREAQWRPCRLETKNLKEVADWIEHYRKLWEERFERLDSVLRQLQQPDDSNERSLTNDDEELGRSSWRGSWRSHGIRGTASASVAGMDGGRAAQTVVRS